MACAANGHDFFHRVRQQFVFADRLIRQLVDETAVRAIFQQAADQIGQQVAMSADRRICAAVIAVRTHKAVKQPLPHAVQPLEFKIALFARPLEDRRDRQGIMRRKRRTDIARGEHVLGAGKIGHIGRGLPREQREVAQAAFLRLFDFAVPIRALHKAHLQDARRVPAQRVGPGEDGTGTFRIGLHRHAKSVPAG